VPGLGFSSLWTRGSPVSSERVERKLAAILAADIAGYSRLMGVDEVGPRDEVTGSVPLGDFGSSTFSGTRADHTSIV